MTRCRGRRSRLRGPRHFGVEVGTRGGRTAGGEARVRRVFRHGQASAREPTSRFLRRCRSTRGPGPCRVHVRTRRRSPERPDRLRRARARGARQRLRPDLLARRRIVRGAAGHRLSALAPRRPRLRRRHGAASRARARAYHPLHRHSRIALRRAPGRLAAAGGLRPSPRHGPGGGDPGLPGRGDGGPGGGPGGGIGVGCGGGRHPGRGGRRHPLHLPRQRRTGAPQAQLPGGSRRRAAGDDDAAARGRCPTARFELHVVRRAASPLAPAGAGKHHPGHHPRAAATRRACGNARPRDGPRDRFPHRGVPGRHRPQAQPVRDRAQQLRRSARPLRAAEP